jgi:dTDP-4-dehydrorhamnose reductase
MRVAVTGSTGRLGSALVAALEDAPFTGPFGPVAWTRADLDLDAPAGVARVLDRDRPEVVVHAAAWTDVDGCARDPDLARRRNGDATGVLATLCADRGVDLIVVSTNEVFDGTRTDERGYEPADPTEPANPYGASKLAGERAATEAYAQPGARGVLGIARTAWLFGPPGRDFPRKILEAADRAAQAGDPLRVVADEWGTPTYAADVADAICELLADDAHGGVHHLVNGGVASRAAWAADILRRLGVDVPVEPVPATTWVRASVPPRWGVLAATPLPSGEPMRPWPQAMADYAPTLRRTLAR